MSPRWNGHKEFWRERPVLITGIAGFLGQRLARIMSAMGARVYGCDQRAFLTLAQGKIVERVELLDIRNWQQVQRNIVESKPDSIFHLAAISQVVDAVQLPLQTYQTNVLGTANVLEAAKQLGTPVVVASSDKAYGRPATLPANEETFLNPFHPYDVSKAAADLIARSYAEIYDQPVAITRCGNIYGPGDDNWQRIIPGTIRSLLARERPIIRSDGSHVREYNYIDDILEAYMLVAQHLINDGDRGFAYTISDQNATLSVLDVAEKIADLMRLPLNAIILGEAQEEEKMISLDSSMIRLRLGWEPRIPFENGLKNTIIWVKNQFNYPLGKFPEREPSGR